MTLILNGTVGVSDVDGSAATPAIRGTDANTGMFFPAADTIAFAEGGVEAMRLDSAGNVGIGTSSPTASFGRSLQIYNDANTGTVASNTYLLVESLNRNANIELAGNSTATNSVSFSDTPGTTVAGLASSVSDQNLIFRTGGTTERMRIDSSGNVGVGTSSPNNSLTVSRGGADVARFVNSGSNGGDWQLKIGGGGFEDRKLMITDRFSGADNVRMAIDSSGNAGIGTTSPASRLNVATASSGTPLTVTMSSNTSGSGAGDRCRIDCYSATNAGAAYQLGFIDFDRSDGTGTASQLTFNTRVSGTVAERARINGSGQFGVGGNPDTLFSVFTTTLATNSQMVHVSRPGTADVFFIYAADGYGPNGAAATVKVGSQGSTGRSINATGTINASGADYAEYMTKNGDFVIAKGDVCGVDSTGKLTNKFSEAVSFVVKSTDPSYVGGDGWGTKDQIGYDRPHDLSDEATDEEKAKYADDMAAFESALEAARQFVDRIAFAGQVPVNVTGAVAGQYIIPVEDSGAIKGEAVSNPTFEQYKSSVGKVIAIQEDGRAIIIVKVA